jgi:hypothetical protein
MTASKQEPETAEYQLVMKLEIPSKMREEGIRRYIHSQVFRDGWGEAFQTNYIHSKEFRVTRSTHSSQPVPELPENYWHCPFRKGCEVGESYCDWPCDKWATWHDDNIRKTEREQVLDAMREEILLCRYNISYPEIQDESADHLLKKIESLRGGEQK